MKINLTLQTKISESTRGKQIRSLFDVPLKKECTIEWCGDAPIEDREWSVGAIIGPSGCGKTSIARHMFPVESAIKFNWGVNSVIDDIRSDIPIEKVSETFSSVGFSTIPSWLKPYSVLSNGEKFRVTLARTLLEYPKLSVMDEFTSVVDRQVAKIGSHAVQKHVRKTNGKFVAISCHYDILDWLKPDWVLEPASMTFDWGRLWRRPEMDIKICRVKYDMWRLFSPFHYLTSELHKASACFCLYLDGAPSAFCGNIHFVHPRTRDIIRCSRAVTLPDYQGLGLIFILLENVGAHYSAIGKRYRIYPSHPSFIKSCCRSTRWKLIQRPGECSVGRTNIVKNRQCAVFEYLPDRSNSNRISYDVAMDFISKK